MNKLILAFVWVAFVPFALSAQTMDCAFTPWPSGEAVATLNTSTTPPNNVGQNGVTIIGFWLPYDCITTGVAFNVIKQDANTSNMYDVGLVFWGDGAGTSGTLAVHTGALSGPVFTPNLNVVHLPWIGCAQGCKLLSGIYGLAVGTNCSSTTPPCAQLSGDNDFGQIYAFDVSNPAPPNLPIWNFVCPPSGNGLPASWAKRAPWPSQVAPVAYTGTGAGGHPKPPTILIY